MKITIEPTEDVEFVNGAPARFYRGVREDGTQVVLAVCGFFLVVDPEQDELSQQRGDEEHGRERRAA
jgi:hypothetical protein